MLALERNHRRHLFVVALVLIVICSHNSPASCYALDKEDHPVPFNPVALTAPKTTLCGDYGVYLNETRKCYPEGSKGPCPELMAVKTNEENLEIGTCECIPRSCGDRPTVYWPDTNRCYYIYDQGPCLQGEWLVPARTGLPKCETIPCPDKFNQQFQPAEASQSNKDNNYRTNYVFSYENKCYTTRNVTDSPCPEGKSAIFWEAHLPHGCTGPFGCGSASTSGGANHCPSGKLPDSRGGCEPKTDFE